MKGKVAILGLILIFLILNVLDLVLTVMAIENGKGTEANPFMAGLIESGISQYTVVKISVGVIIALLLFVLYKEHLRAARITAAFLVIAYIFIVSNNVIINASALTIGNNVVSVGAGYKYITADDRAQFVYAQSYQDDQGNTKYRIRLVSLDTDGTYSDTILVTNISSSVNSVCIASNHKLYFSLSNNEIWVRTSTSTNPLDFYQYKDDTDYFQKIATGYTAYGLTPVGNRIYFFDKNDVFYIDLSNYASINSFKTFNVGSYGTIVAIAANNNYVYVAYLYDKQYTHGNYYIKVVSHDGEVIQSFSESQDYSDSAYGYILLSDNYVYFKMAAVKNYNYKIPLKDDGTLDWDNRTTMALNAEGKQQARECYGSNVAVYLYNSQVNTFSLDSTFVPDESGGGGGGTGTTQYYNVTLRFVNAETNQELSNVYVKGYVYYNGEIYQSINGYYDYNLTLTVPAGSNIEIGQAHKDLFESDLEKEQYTLTIVNVQSDTERIIYFYPLALKTTLEVYFIDTSTNAQIPNVYLNLQDNEGNVIANGTYDYSASFEVWVGKTYYWNASKSGYFNDSGSVSITTNQITYVVWAYLTPVKTPSDVTNNTIVEFIVKKNPGYTGEYYPLAGAVVTLNGESRVTNSNGYTYFEVAKNSTNSYIVSADGYYSKSGIVEVGTDPVLVEVVLDVLVTPSTVTTTTTGGAGGGGTGGGSGGTGYTPDEDLRQAARDTLTQFYQVVPQFFGLIFLLFLMAAIKSVMRR